jgi:hypothetical protein
LPSKLYSTRRNGDVVTVEIPELGTIDLRGGERYDWNVRVFLTPDYIGDLNDIDPVPAGTP